MLDNIAKLISSILVGIVMALCMWMAIILIALIPFIIGPLFIVFCLYHSYWRTKKWT